MASSTRVRRSPAYSCVEQLLARDQCVILDGGIATELGELEIPGDRLSATRPSGARGRCSNAPRDVHARAPPLRGDRLRRDLDQHLGPPTAMRGERGPRLGSPRRSTGWTWRAGAMRLARDGHRRGGARRTRCAVAFSLNGDVDDARGLRDASELLGRAFEEEPPDLILLETLSLIRDSTYATVETLLDTGLPGVAQLPPLPPRRLRRVRRALGRARGRRVRPRRAPLRGDGRRRAADQLHAARPRRRDAARGCATSPTCRSASIPNLGYYTERRLAPRASASAATSTPSWRCSWREEGAQIIGGCCGVGPEHIAAARERAGRHAARRTRARPARPTLGARRAATRAGRAPLERRAAAARCSRCRLPRDHGRARRVRSHARAASWPGSTCSASGIGAGQRCLDVGCGTGLLTVQLALNGAAHVHAIDIDERAVENTLANAFRNGVADRVTRRARSTSTRGCPRSATT